MAAAVSRTILTLNSGSSSLKASLFRADGTRRDWVERYEQEVLAQPQMDTHQAYREKRHDNHLVWLDHNSGASVRPIQCTPSEFTPLTITSAPVSASPSCSR